MSLHIQPENLDGIALLTLSGDVDLGSAPELRAVLAPVFEEVKPRLLLDLSGVGFMDSTGIGILVNALNRVREKSGAVAFCGASARVHRVLQIAGLTKALPLYESREAALSALNAKTATAEAA